MQSAAKSRRLAELTNDTRKARIVNFLNKEEFFFPIRVWPTWAAEDVLNPHKDNPMRFKFFQFLTFNGLDPEVAKQWTLMSDVRYGEPIAGTYDNSASTQLDSCIKHAADGTLFDRLACMDMKLGRVRYIWQGHEYTGENREAAWKRAKESGG